MERIRHFERFVIILMRKKVYASPYRQYVKDSHVFSRLFIIGALVALLLLIIVARLFQLQIIDHKEYRETAKSQHFGEITLNAKRGEVLVQDTHSGEFSKLATNTTLDLVYVDPMVAEDKVTIAKKLAPLLFNRNDYEACVNEPAECPYDIEEQPDLQAPVPVSASPWVIEGAGNSLHAASTVNSKEKVVKPYLTMVDEVAARVLRKISQSEVDFVSLLQDADPDVMSEVVNAKLPGVFTQPEKFMIYADPTLIPEGRLPEVAQQLSKILGGDVKTFESRLSRRKVRYVFLKNRLEPEVSRKIKSLDLKGVVLVPEHWRFYPENQLASHIVGFLNRNESGQYGIEGYFDADLEGKKGIIYAEKDPMGRQITVGSGSIVDPVDGDTIILTIDRIIQKRVEEILSEAVERYRADSGQVLIMDPFTGAIIAMANYPAFDPNSYTDVFELDALENAKSVYKTVPVFKKNEKGKYIPIDEADLENDEIEKYVYKNKFGASVYKNKLVSEFYEPGSVFKPIVMSMALDAKEVEPHTTFLDDGPLEIDEFTIKNVENIYRGKTSMSEVLAYSMNTGMSFVAKKLGAKLMHQYLLDYGFGDYTNIRLEGETKGRVDYYKKWSRAQLLTTSFGQGIVATPLQVLTAWAAMANGGKLMQPYIVDTVIKEGKPVKTQPQVVRRVISEETSSIITSMNVNAVRTGVARPADIPGYLIAGKTGTSQVAGKDGKYETGEGSTITSFAGYTPALEPKFVMLVKFDRPRIGDNTWGSTTAAPTFKKIAEFLLDYYNIQPSA